MDPRAYAAAAAALIAQGKSDKEVADALIAELGRRGMLKMLPSLVAELKHGLAREEKRAPRIEVAHSKGEAAAKKEAAAAGIEGSVTVNPTLVSGWRALANGRLVDHSGKQALVNLYRSVTR